MHRTASKGPSAALQDVTPLVVSKSPRLITGGFLYSEHLAYLSRFGESRRADSNRLPLLQLRVRCSPSGRTEGLTSRTAALSPNTSTEPMLNGLLLVGSTHPCRKIRIATPLFFRYASSLTARY